METIVQTLPICQVRQVAYATFSILQVFHNGEAYLVEFDNPSCIFIRGGKLMPIPQNIREVEGKKINEYRFKVQKGDALILMSDGTIHAGVGQLLNLSLIHICLGTVLDIKPVLTVNEAGQIVARNKVRTLKRAVTFMMELLKEKQGGYPEVGIVHSGCEALAGELRERLLREKLKGVEEIIVSEINPTIGAHIGPDAVGVVFLKKQ